MMECEELQIWFRLVKTSEVDEIMAFLKHKPHCVSLRRQPLMDTAVFVVIKTREDEEGKTILQMLVEYGAELNVVNSMGQNPLFYSIAHNKPKICRYLVKQKVDPAIEDAFGQTPKEYALSLCRNEFVSILEMGQQCRNNRSLLYEPKQTHIIDTQFIPKLTYRLCKLTREGKVENVTAEDMSRLQQQKPDLIYLLNRPNTIPDEPFDFRQDWRKVGLNIVDKLSSLSDSFWFRKCAQVWRLEEKDDLPSIDLEVIRLKLLHHMYVDPQDLRRDIVVIVTNCKKRLGSDHQISRSAREMSFQFQTLANDEGYNDLIKKFNELK